MHGFLHIVNAVRSVIFLVKLLCMYVYAQSVETWQFTFYNNFFLSLMDFSNVCTVLIRDKFLIFKLTVKYCC